MIARVAVAALLVLLVATTTPALTLRLEWGPPLVGVPDGYSVYKKVGAAQYELLASVPASSLTYTDTAVAFGESCWQVTAYNAGGESPPSNEVCFFAVAAPSQPVNLRLVP